MAAKNVGMDTKRCSELDSDLLCQYRSQKLECLRCNQPPIVCGNLVMALFTSIDSFYHMSNKTDFGPQFDILQGIIANIHSDSVIGDQKSDSINLRSKLFRITNAIGIPLLYLPWMNRNLTNLEFKKTLFELTNLLLDVNVPYDIPCVACPSLYHAFLRNRKVGDFVDEKFCAQFTLQWLKHYLIPLPNSILSEVLSCRYISNDIMELFIRAGASPYVVDKPYDSNLYNNNTGDEQKIKEEEKEEKEEEEEHEKIKSHTNLNFDEKQWRASLCYGSILDVLDTTNSWHSAHIVSVLSSTKCTTQIIEASLESSPKLEVFPTLRRLLVKDICNSREDYFLISYDYYGWEWSEWIPQSSPRFRPWYSETSKIYNQRYNPIPGATLYQRAVYYDKHEKFIVPHIDNAYKYWSDDRTGFISLITCSISCSNIIYLSHLIFEYYGNFIPSASFTHFIEVEMRQHFSI